MKDEKKRKKIIAINGAFQLLIFILIVLGLLFASIVFQLWLWKIIMVAVFGLPMLTFWQMVGLDLLFWTFTGKVNDDVIKINYDGEEM
jgi:energy-coupling factor transporter transmembrane protein EcfT